MQTDSFTNLFAWNYSPWVCWPCTHPAGYSAALHHNDCSDYALVIRCCKECLIGHLPEEHSFRSPARWSTQGFHDAHTNTFRVNVPHWWVFGTFLVFVQGPSQMKRHPPTFFFYMEKCSPLYMKRIQLKQNCSVKLSIYPSKCTWSKIFPWNLVFIQDHRCRYLSTKGFIGARRGINLQTFLVLQYQPFVSQTLRRGEMEFGSEPNSEILFSPYCSL